MQLNLQDIPPWLDEEMTAVVRDKAEMLNILEMAKL